jgi:hypothetical protein
LVCMQSGDEECLAAWGRICAASRKEFQAIYDRLGVTLNERGESFYNPMLKGKKGGRGCSCWHWCLRLDGGPGQDRCICASMDQQPPTHIARLAGIPYRICKLLPIHAAALPP